MKLSGRQEEALRPARARCVTAGAGAGKTKVLVEKYIQLLEQGSSVDQILALTFTEKAAAEMKERVRKIIWDREGEKWKALRDEFNWCQISTFHSFCARLLREKPFESGVAPRFGVLEELEGEELMQEAFEYIVSIPKGDALAPTVISVLSDTSEYFLKKALWLMFRERSELQEFLRSFSSPPELVEIWKGLTEESIKRMAKGFLEDEEFIAAVGVLQRLAQRYVGTKDAGCQYLAEANEPLDVIASSEDPAVVCSALISLSEAKGRRGLGSSKVFDAKDLEDLRQSYDAVRTKFEKTPPECLAADDEEDLRGAAKLMCKLKEISTRFQEHIEDQKSRMNALDFEDMVQIVRRMLRENDELAKELSSRYQHVLVDEFQDTDRAQSEIIWRIVGSSPDNDKLFIVGDPKQSIYLFRNVDVSMFKLAQRKIKDEMKGDYTNLDINFRSSPQVIGFVNQVFRHLMPSSDKVFEFQYESMGHCESRQDDQGTVEMLVQSEEDSSVDEAEMVARRIRVMVDDGGIKAYWNEKGEHIKEGRRPTYGDIAMLFRSRTHLKLYERRLRQLDIPYHVHAGLGFFQRQEIIDVLNILRFLDNRGDDVSLYAVLRSPYFAFSDDELFLICTSGGGQLYPRLLRYAEAGGAISKDAVRVLEEWLEVTRRVPVSELLQRIYLRSGIYATYGALRNGEQMLANLEKLWLMALNSQNDVSLSLDDFVEWLGRKAEEEQKEGEAQLDAAQGDVVHIMTVHAAKGLEFPIVFVPELSSRLHGDNDEVNFDPDRGMGVSIPDPEEGYELRPTSVKLLIDSESKERDIAERKRLLYVAMTRAKDHLVLSGQPPRDPPRDMWMDWIWQALRLTQDDLAHGAKDLGGGVALRLTSRVKEPDIGSEARRETADIGAVMGSIQAPAQLPEARPRLVLTPSMIRAYRENHFAFERHYVYGIPEVSADGFGSFSAEKLGTAMHEVLRGIEPEVALHDLGLDTPKQIERLADEKESFLGLDEIQRASRHVTEVPIVAMIGDVPVTGNIDRLVFYDGGRYMLLDYKTDALLEGEEKEAAKEHELQLAIYSELLSPSIGEPERSALYFVSSRRLFDIERRDRNLVEKEIKELAKAIEELQAILVRKHGTEDVAD